MPIYEYRCQDCPRVVSVFFRSFSEARDPVCTHCGSSRLTRLISQVTVIKSSGESLNFPSAESLGDVDEDDPRAYARMLRRMRQEVGDETGSLTEHDLWEAGLSPGDLEEGGLPEDLDDADSENED